MKKYISLLVLLLFIKIGWAQNTNLEFKAAIKFSNQTTVIGKDIYVLDTTLYDWLYRNGTYQVFHPTFAVQWTTKKNNIHEIELTDLRFSSGPVILTSLRYDYIINFNKKKDSKIIPSLGIGINPYYFQLDKNPEIETQYGESYKYIGAKIFITPGLTYYCGSKFFINFNIPVCILDAYYKSYQSYDPTLTIDEMTINSTNFGAIFPYYFSARFGIGLKF
jgi:hypothetical protein